MSSVSRQFGTASGVKRNNFPDWELIWENEDPTASFAAQIISLNLAKYGWVKVEAILASAENNYAVTMDVPVGTDDDYQAAMIQMVNRMTTSIAAGEMYAYSRCLWAVEDGVHFLDCSRRRLNTTSDAANSTQNARVIPQRIWGKTTSSSAGGDASFRDSGAGMRLLWENPNPTAEFAAQTISVDLSDYDAAYIPVMSSAGNVVDAIFADVGGATSYCQWVNLSTNLVARQRGATATATGVVFASCVSRTQGSSSNTTTNGQLLPYRIYGVKFG